jgi:DNA-binding GntR family transcriptional regulator
VSFGVKNLFLSRGFEQVRTEYHEILNLCCKREVDAACVLLKRHIQSAGRTLQEAVQQRREKTA